MSRVARLVAGVLAGCGSERSSPTRDGSVYGAVPTPQDACAGPGTTWSDPVVCALRGGFPGITLREGRFGWLTTEGCAEVIAQEGTCYNNHNLSPYALYDFPEDDEGSALPKYRLEQHEALVYLGRTPPRGRYFGFNNYQVDRFDGLSRVLTMGSVSPTANILTLRTAPGPDAPFDAYTALIHTANAETADRATALLRPLLAAEGYDPDIVNVRPIAYVDHEDAERLRSDPQYDPDSIVELHMGYDPLFDDRYLLSIRVGAPEDLDDPYFDPELVPATVFKLAFDDWSGYAPFSEYPKLPPFGDTGEWQGDALRRAQERVAALVGPIHGAPGTSSTTISFGNEPQKSGFYCVNGWGEYGCGANNDDARYLITDCQFVMQGGPEAPDLAVWAVGIIHDVVAGLAPNAPQVTYSSISVKNDEVGLGVVAVVDRDLEGSYDHYFPGNEAELNDDQARSIYVHRFARACLPGEPHCSVVPLDFPGVSTTDRFGLVERAYLNRTSATAPHETSLWEPIAVAVGTSMRVDPLEPRCLVTLAPHPLADSR